MKSSLALVVASLPLFAVGVASAQNGMMNGDGGMWGGWIGGYGGIWGPLLLLVVAIGLVALVVQRKGK